MNDWQFDDPPYLEVISLSRILSGGSSVRLVTRDNDDGSWQFLDGEHVFEREAIVVTLGEMIDFDATLAELAELPIGWYAWRASGELPWKRVEGEPSPETISS